MKKVIIALITLIILLCVGCTTFRASLEGLEKGEIEITKEH